MLCEECQKNQATVAITVSAGDEKTTRNLCNDCLKKMEHSLASGDLQSFLSSVLSLLSSKQVPQAQSCTGCGLTYHDFEKSGKLGCANCYITFAKELRPMLRRIHGDTHHVGRMPESFLKANEREKQIEILKQKMDDAVAVENFEDAAKYRDELRALINDQEEDGNHE